MLNHLKNHVYISCFIIIYKVAAISDKPKSTKRPATARILNKQSVLSISEYDNSPEYKNAKALYDAGDFGFPSRPTTSFDPKSLEIGYQKRLEHLRVRQFIRDRERRLNFQSVNSKIKGTRNFADSKVYFLFGKPPLAPFGVGAKTDYVEHQVFLNNIILFIFRENKIC